MNRCAQDCTENATAVATTARATTAIQTLASTRYKNGRRVNKRAANRFLNSCHSYAEDSPVVKLHWPEQYRGEA